MMNISILLRFPRIDVMFFFWMHKTFRCIRINAIMKSKRIQVEAKLKKWLHHPRKFKIDTKR